MPEKKASGNNKKTPFRRRKKVTASDIAERAGVSIATVSRVLNRQSAVNDVTRARVLEAAETLGYVARTTPAARVIPEGGDGGLILINIPSLSNPFYDELIKGARTSVIRHGYTLLINESHINYATIPSIMGILVRQKAAGLITLNHIETPLCRQLAEVTEVVQCAEYNEDANLPFVGIDNAAAAKAAVEHLISAGCRRIAFMNGPLSYIYASGRLSGYRAALRDAGIEEDGSIIISLPDINPELALSSTLQLLSQPEPPDAIFSASDALCAPILRACSLSGFRVPEDVAVVGFDNMDITRHLLPSITTVNQPKMQMGFLAAEMLFERIANPDAPVRSTLLDTELIVRESTARQES